MTVRWIKNRHGKVVSAGYRFRLDGKWHRKSGYKTKQEARDAEAAERKRLKREKEKILIGTVSCLDLFNKHTDQIEARRPLNTFRDKKRCYKAFIQHIGSETPITKVVKHDITAFLDPIAIEDKKKKTKRVNRQLRHIRACFNWAIDEGLMTGRNPCQGIKDYPEEKYIPRIPPNKDLAMVYLKMNQDQRDFCDVIRFTMSRKGEVVRLTWNDVNMEKSVAVFYTRKRRGEGWKAMPKPINSKLQEILERRYKNRRKDDPRVFYFKEKELRFLEYICKELKIPVFGFHALRHRAASILNDSKKASMKEIQLWLGHDRQTTTETYLHHISETFKDTGAVLADDDFEDALEEKDEKEEAEEGK